MVSKDVIKSEKGLRDMINRNLKKEFHPGTKPSIDFIYDILEDAYNRGIKYDVSNMYNKVYTFAVNSTHQSDYCIKKVMQMKWKSDDCSEPVDADSSTIIFYDVEVFPNLFVLCWKARGNTTIKMVNPSPEQVEELCRYRLVGFNNRRYDNHILYARLMGYTNEQLYMGMSVDANECMEIIRNSLFNNKEFRREKYLEKLGELIFYIAEQSNAMGEGAELEALFERAMTVAKTKRV